MAQEQSLLVARTLCQQNQAESHVPVKVSNITNEPVHFFKHTSLGILILIQEMADIILETVYASTVDASTVGQMGLVQF